MKKSLLTLLVSFPLMMLTKGFSQNVSINTTGNAADASAMLDVTSTNKGLLIPRMTQTQRTGISSPADALLVYQTDGTKGFYYYSSFSSAWIMLANSGSGGTVTSTSVVTANGISGTVATATTTPAITLTLGNITPTSVAATGNVTGANLSGTNTGDETNTTIKTKLGAASASTDGYLTLADWNTFNNKASTTNSWSTTGNASTTPGTNYIGTSDAQDFVFKTNNTERMRIVNGVSSSTGTAGDITIGNTTSGTLRSAKELVLRQDGDAFGQSTLRLRNRSGENGAIFETIGASANLVDFIFRTGTATTPITSNIRFEARGANQKITGNTTEWQIGQPDNTNGGPTLVVGAAGTGSASSFLIGNVGIGSANPTAKLQVEGTNPLKLFGVAAGTSTTSDSLLTITSGLVRKLPMSTFGSGSVTSVSGTNGVTVATATTTPVIGLGAITPTSVAATGTVTGSNVLSTNATDIAGKVTANAAITGATKTKITYDAKGLVTAGADATTSDIAEGTNQYYTNTRARSAISLTTTGTSGAATYNSGTGVLNIPAYAPGTGTVTSVSVTSVNGVSGTVATNTTTPAISLTLGAITPTSVTATGDIKTNGSVYVDNAGANIGINSPGVIFGGAASGETISSKRSAGGNQYGLDFYTNNANVMSVTSGGNVGIGINNPAYKLQVNAASNPLFLTGLQDGTNTAADSLLTVTNGLVRRFPMSTFASSANTWSTTGNSGIAAATNFLGTTDLKSLRFRTNNVQRFLIDSAGNVAIGKAPVQTPGDIEKLLVDAGSTASDSSSSINVIAGRGYINNYLQLNIQNKSPGNSASSDIVATADNGSETANFVDLGINGSGYTGSNIETGKANDGYLISSGNDFYMVNSSPNKSMLFLTGGTGVAQERMRILANGRVGMGVQDPTSQFVVKDTMEIRRTGPLSQLLFTNTAGTGDFRIGGDGGDLFWQGGGGRALQMGSFWTTVLAGDRQNTNYPGFISSLSGTGVLVPSQRDGSVALGIQANSGSQSANLTEWRTSSGTVLSAINKNGYLGLGTSNPTALLNVAGANPLRLMGVADGTNTTADSLLTITSGLVRKLPMSTFSTPANAWSTTGNAGTTSGTNFLGTTDLKSLRFRTNNIQGMLLDSAGNVAIGNGPVQTTGTNIEKLLVDGGSTSANPTTSFNLINGKGYINNYLQLNIQNKSPGASASSDVVATADNGDESTNFVDMGINSSGNTSNYFGAANDAYLYSSTQNMLIGTAASGKSLSFLTGGGTQSTNERMRIDGSGNVGIGTTSPAQKLDVNGTIVASGTAYPNYQYNSANRMAFGESFVPQNETGSVVQYGSGINSRNMLFAFSKTAIHTSFLGDDGAQTMIGSEGTTNPITFRTGLAYNSTNIMGSGSEVMRITGGGNVGIGTTTPSTKLHVQGANPLTLLGVAAGTSTSADSLLTITSGLVRKLPMSSFAPGGSDWSTIGNAGTTLGTNFLGTTDLKSLRFRTNNVQDMLLDSAGNVAIGNGPIQTAGTNIEKFLVDGGSTSANPTTSFNLINGKGYINNYLQLNIQNKSPGAAASSDVVATADNGDESTNFVDMGINSSGNTSNYFGAANDAYLYSSTQNMLIGTAASGKNLSFLTGGGTQSTNERMRIDGSGNVGIGTITPSQKLDVTGSVNVSANVLAQGIVSDNNAVNNGTLTPGLQFGNTGSGEGISSKRTAGANQYGLDFYTNTTNRMSIALGGNIGIGVNNPGYKLTVAGIVAPSADNAYSLGGGTGNRWTALYAANGTIQTSDRRLKTNIKDLKYGLKEVLAMQPVSYNWKEKPTTDNKIGLIAQDVKKLVPEVVTGDEAKEKLGMNYAELVPVLVNAIKEQQKQIDELKQMVKELQKK